MKKVACDILIVGAGPAGCAAARAAAERGARVRVVERRTQVGVPVQCAEYIPALLLGQLDLGQNVVAQSVRGMKTQVPGAPVKVTAAPGYTIFRDRFDQALAHAARAAGATIMLGTRALGQIDQGRVMLRSQGGDETEIEATVIIGADGPRSTVGHWVGAVNRRLLPGIQVTVPLVAPLKYNEIYFSPDIMAGYGWLFPKGRVANVGLGFKRAPGGQPRIRQRLDEFLDRLRRLGKVSGTPLSAATGWIPTAPLTRAVYNQILLVGDAAGHTHPITGAGIFTAVTGGKMAGRWAARAVTENNTALLAQYDREWRDFFGETLQRGCQRRQLMERRWEDFHHIIRRCWIAYRDYYEG